MVTTATGSPPLSLTAWRITAGGMGMPTVAMSTAEDCVGCLSNLALREPALLNRAIGDLASTAVTAVPARVSTAASAGIGGIAGGAG